MSTDKTDKQAGKPVASVKKKASRKAATKKAATGRKKSVIKKAAVKKGSKPSAVSADRMPTSEKDRALLLKRAEALSSSHNQISQPEHAINYLQVRIDQARYGILQSDSVEITTLRGISPVPCTPDFIVGIISNHGAMVTVIDLLAFLGLGKTPIGQESRVIIIETGHIKAGILVDNIEQESSYRETDLKPSLASRQGISTDFIRGLYQGNISILDVSRIFEDPRMTINETVNH